MPTTTGNNANSSQQHQAKMQKQEATMATTTVGNNANNKQQCQKQEATMPTTTTSNNAKNRKQQWQQQQQEATMPLTVLYFPMRCKISVMHLSRVPVQILGYSLIPVWHQCHKTFYCTAGQCFKHSTIVNQNACTDQELMFYHSVTIPC